LHAATQTTLYKQIKACQQCDLAKTRQNVVYGRGDPRAPLWLVGEAPGRDEDIQGQAFVGRSGRMLDLCLSRKDIVSFFITNIVKCRPPENRDPSEVEFDTCALWLTAQLRKYEPRVIVAMGRYSIGYFLNLGYAETRKMRVGQHLGHVQRCPWQPDLAIMPTYHPAYLLRNALEAKSFLRQLARANTLCQKLLNTSR
jgi:DNA polymerase